MGEIAAKKPFTHAAAKKRVKTHKIRSFRVLAACALGFCLEMMDIMLIAYALRLIIAEFSLSNTAGGLIGTATNFAMLAGGVIFALIAPRLGYVRSFAASIYLFALATAAIFYAPNFAILLSLRAIAGLGAGAEYGLSMALLCAHFPRAQLGKYSAIVGIFGQLGAAASAIAAGLILESLGWRALFLVGLIPLALGLYVQIALDEPLHLRPVKKEKTTAAFAGKKIITVALLFMCCVQIGGYFGLMNWLPTLAAKALNLNLSSGSYWMLATIAGMCCGMLVFGKLFDRFGARLAFSIFLIGSAAGVGAFAFVTNYAQLLTAGFAVGFFSNGMFAGYGALISKIFPAHACALANNFIIGTGRAVGGLSPLAIGAAMDFGASTQALMLVIACAYLSSLLVCLIFLKGAK